MFNSVTVGSCDGVSVVLRHVGSILCFGRLKTALLNMSSCGNGSEGLLGLMGHEDWSVNLGLALITVRLTNISVSISVGVSVL